MIESVTKFVCYWNYYVCNLQIFTMICLYLIGRKFYYIYQSTDWTKEVADQRVQTLKAYMLSQQALYMQQKQII